MKKNSNNNRNNYEQTNSFSILGIFKIVLFILLFSFILSAFVSIIGLFDQNLFARLSNKIDVDETNRDIIGKLTTSGDIPTTSNDDQEDILKDIDAQIKNNTAITLDDVYTNLDIVEYSDIVCFRKIVDDLSYCMIFRKTDKGLVLDGMFIYYAYSPTFVVDQYHFEAKSTQYLNYNNHDFQQYYKNINFTTFGIMKPCDPNSCISFNDYVSDAVMYGFRGFVVEGLNPVRTFHMFYTLLTGLFGTNTNNYANMVEFAYKEIFREFVSFGEYQHIMFSNIDEFSDFWTDVYTSVSNLKKSCLVDYTNSSHIALYSGTCGKEDFQAYVYSSYFKVNYTNLGVQAYSICSKDYSSGHSFNNKNETVAMPEIKFYLTYNESSASTLEEFNQYLEDNNLTLKINTTITNNSKYTKNFTFDGVIDKQTLILIDYLPLGNFNITATASASTIDGETAKLPYITFKNGSFDVDKDVGSFNFYYSLDMSEPEPILLPVLNSKTIFNLSSGYTSVNTLTYISSYCGSNYDSSYRFPLLYQIYWKDSNYYNIDNPFTKTCPGEDTSFTGSNWYENSPYNFKLTFNYNGNEFSETFDGVRYVYRKNQNIFYEYVYFCESADLYLEISFRKGIERADVTICFKQVPTYLNEVFSIPSYKLLYNLCPQLNDFQIEVLEFDKMVEEVK